MSNTQSLSIDDQETIMIDRNEIVKNLQQPLITNKTWIERIKYYFITNDGRIILADLFFTLICVILQHIMGTCYHSVIDGIHIIKWHVFTPPFGAGPHTAVFFFVLSWIILSYCIEHIWVYLTTGIHLSKKRDLIVHGIIVILYFLAFGFNIWGYVLCESTSQVNTSNTFEPGVCRGESKACIPLIAGILASCAAACAFFSEHILALTKMLRRHREFNGSKSNRILP